MSVDTYFPEPIQLSPDAHGPIIEVQTTEQAARLLEDWPRSRGKWYIAAKRACAAASRGRATPAMARLVFMHAAVEARMSSPF